LFAHTRFARAKASAWAERDETFVKRAAFAIVARLAVGGEATDRELATFLPVIRAQAWDDRPYVRKAVNWALREIGKRSPWLNRRAIATAELIRAQGTRPARWIASDALRELRSEAVRARLPATAPAGRS